MRFWIDPKPNETIGECEARLRLILWTHLWRAAEQIVTKAQDVSRFCWNKQHEARKDWYFYRDDK